MVSHEQAAEPWGGTWKVGWCPPSGRPLHRRFSPSTSYIPFKKSTEVFFRTDNDSIIVNSYCGLSVYIPLPIYEAAGVNDSYRQTDWSDYTDYK